MLRVEYEGSVIKKENLYKVTYIKIRIIIKIKNLFLIQMKCNKTLPPINLIDN